MVNRSRAMAVEHFDFAALAEFGRRECVRKYPRQFWFGFGGGVILTAVFGMAFVKLTRVFDFSVLWCVVP